MFLSCQATCRAHSAELVIIDTPEENEFIRLEIIKLKGKKRKEKQKYRTVGTIPKSNRKIVTRGKIDIPSIHIQLLTFLARYMYMDAHFPSIHIHGHSLSQHTYTWPLTFLAYIYMATHSPSIHLHGDSLSQHTYTWPLTFLACIYMATHFPSMHIHGHSLSQHTYTWPLTFLARYMYFNEKINIRPHI